nr:MAG TPA: hypothetical protein [Caudoviricetes sp.]
MAKPAPKKMRERHTLLIPLFNAFKLHGRCQAG